MNRLLLFLLFFSYMSFAQKTERQVERQGSVTFFSYTSVENIEAKNNQGFSFFEPNSGKIAVNILMNAFQFKKSLMYTHFNQSYIESDLYPKATFEGVIDDFEPNTSTQIKIIKGSISLHGVTKTITIKSKIIKLEKNYQITGDFDLAIKDFNIKIPTLLSPNIAKTINVTFDFKYLPYEN